MVPNSLKDVGTWEFTQDEAQRHLDAKFVQPMHTDLGIDINHVQVKFANHQIELTVEASGVKLSTPFTVSAQIIGELRYDSTQGAFFFRPTQVSLLDVQVSGTSLGNTVGRAVELLGTLRMVELKNTMSAEVNAWARELF